MRLLSVQVIGSLEEIGDLGLYCVDENTFNQLFKNGRDLFFFCDFNNELSWKMIKEKLVKANSLFLKGIQGTIHLEKSFVAPDSFPNRIIQVDDPLSITRSDKVSINKYYFQVLDGASNSTCDIYEVDKDTFNQIFTQGQKVLLSNECPELEDRFWTKTAYRTNVKKSIVPRLDGILIL